MIDKPKKIGKYDVVDVLGRGAMGVVYRGHDPYVDRPVAIKIATNVGIEGAQGVARRMFVNEARSAGRLDHPNILKVYEAGEENDLPYMVMEYIAGGDTLRNYCKEGSLLPVPVVMRIVRQAADALDYAHEQGVLHRDIKPANLMLTREGQAKIGDFGIARRIGADQTQITGWFGSPLYMSPEQAQDLEMTPQSDLFSLGSVFYELLTGKAAFAAKGLTGLIQKILHEDPPPVHEIRTDVPGEVWVILKKMLEKDVTKRYKRGAEIVRDIDTLLNDVRNVPLIFSDDQKIQRMSTLVFFEGFGKAELKELNKAAVWQRFAPGAQIFAEGSRENTAFFVIVDGAVMVDISGVQIKELESGECFGEMEYLAGGTRSASITTSRETTVLKVERDFKEWASLPCQLRMGKAFQAMLVKRLRETSRELARALR